MPRSRNRPGLPSMRAGRASPRRVTWLPRLSCSGLSHPMNPIFVHDDASRGLSIDEARLPRNVVPVRPRPGLTDVLFHYRKVIEGAEVHCISSSFAQYLECVPSGRPQYLHRYPRHDGTWSTWHNFQGLE
jgi:hypothetical protein